MTDEEKMLMRLFQIAGFPLRLVVALVGLPIVVLIYMLDPDNRDGDFARLYYFVKGTEV